MPLTVSVVVLHASCTGVAGHQPAAQACTSKRSQPYDPRALLAAVTNTAPQFKGKAQVGCGTSEATKVQTAPFLKLAVSWHEGQDQ
jgi:hypothetical protein